MNILNRWQDDVKEIINIYPGNKFYCDMLYIAIERNDIGLTIDGCNDILEHLHLIIAKQSYIDTILFDKIEYLMYHYNDYKH